MPSISSSSSSCSTFWQAQFGVPKRHIVNTLTATLLFRPVGAIIFGMLADRYGRRIPLMANVIYFSLIELLSGFSSTYTQFLILRALFGIGMGGEWGVGASLAMEQAPRKWRGVLSGILQSGYSIGYLLAAVASRMILPNLGWRWMFWLGALPALLALYIRTKVPESEAWKEHRVADLKAMWAATRGHVKGFPYLVVLMTFMMFLSHGTQDLYPDFLKRASCGRKHDSVDRDPLQRRGGHRRDHLRTTVAAHRPPLQHDRGAGRVAARHSILVIRKYRWRSGMRGLRHADGRAGGVGASFRYTSTSLPPTPCAD